VNCDAATMFDCSHGAREKCIPLESVCNGTDDCGDMIDEAPELCVNHSEYDLSPYQPMKPTYRTFIQFALVTEFMFHTVL